MIDKNIVWTEKYRPKVMEDIVGGFKEELNTALKNQSSMQHLIFHSRTPGVGKTTLARIIAKQLKADVLEINSADDRSIDTARNKIIAFARTRSSNENSRRIIILDEADGLTSLTQKALLAPMETYASNALFIFSCNKLNKLIDTLQSRCNIINFDTPDRKEIKAYIKKICDAENVKYSDEGLAALVNINYPSIRNCITAIQKLKSLNKDVTEDSTKMYDAEYSMIWDLVFKDKKWEDALKYILTHDINIISLNDFFWKRAVEESNIKVIQVTGVNEYKFHSGADNLIIFGTSLTEMI